MIRLCDIRKTYKTRHGSVEVLNGISLTVPDHTLVMLLGESGSGKSTLCNILGLLDTPTAGEYYLDDTPIHTLSQKERTDLRREKVSFVFQSFNLFNNMTALQNCVTGQMSVLRRSRAEAEKIAMEYLGRVGMTPYSHARPAQLSGGEQQRAAIARALAIAPRLLICDEITSALDVTVQKEILELLNTLRTRQGRGLSILFISHDISLVQQFCDRVLVMYRGEIVEEGTPDEVIRNPQNDYTKRLIDSVLS